MAFAAAPGPAASIEVLRHCLHGQLRFDGTGSKLNPVEGRPSTVAAGSTIAVATATGPDGASALLAFTYVPVAGLRRGGQCITDAPGVLCVLHSISDANAWNETLSLLSALVPRLRA